jgi:glucokinase
MYLGIEIGGTKLQLGVGEGTGSLRQLWRGGVETAAGPEGIRRQIAAAVPELLARSGLLASQIQGVGIGFGGPVDDAMQTVIKSHQIPGWENFPLVTWVRERLGWPAVLGNDADVAGLAEALHGAGKGLSPIFYITVGSGIGGGLIIKGEIQRGTGRGAAEIGHLRVPVKSPGGLHYCPLEEVASGWAIQRVAREHALRLGEGCALLREAWGKLENITTFVIVRLADRGDHFALDALHQAWDHLADAICHVVALVCPRRIVIGGGVSLIGEELFFQPLRDLVAGRVFPPFAGCFEIVPAALGEEVVVHGALALARRKLSEQST